MDNNDVTFTMPLNEGATLWDALVCYERDLTKRLSSESEAARNIATGALERIKTVKTIVLAQLDGR